MNIFLPDPDSQVDESATPALNVEEAVFFKRGENSTDLHHGHALSVSSSKWSDSLSRGILGICDLS
jgi:hypothetical protein